MMSLSLRAGGTNSPTHSHVSADSKSGPLTRSHSSRPSMLMAKGSEAAAVAVPPSTRCESVHSLASDENDDAIHDKIADLLGALDAVDFNLSYADFLKCVSNIMDEAHTALCNLERDDARLNAIFSLFDQEGDSGVPVAVIQESMVSSGAFTKAEASSLLAGAARNTNGIVTRSSFISFFRGTLGRDALPVLAAVAALAHEHAGSHATYDSHSGTVAAGAEHQDEHRSPGSIHAATREHSPSLRSPSGLRSPNSLRSPSGLRSPNGLRSPLGLRSPSGSLRSPSASRSGNRLGVAVRGPAPGRSLSPNRARSPGRPRSAGGSRAPSFLHRSPSTVSRSPGDVQFPTRPHSAGGPRRGGHGAAPRSPGVDRPATSHGGSEQRRQSGSRTNARTSIVEAALSDAPWFEFPEPAESTTSADSDEHSAEDVVEAAYCSMWPAGQRFMASRQRRMTDTAVMPLRRTTSVHRSRASQWDMPATSSSSTIRSWGDSPRASLRRGSAQGSLRQRRRESRESRNAESRSQSPAARYSPRCSLVKRSSVNAILAASITVTETRRASSLEQSGSKDDYRGADSDDGDFEDIEDEQGVVRDGGGEGDDEGTGSSVDGSVSGRERVRGSSLRNYITAAAAVAGTTAHANANPTGRARDTPQAKPPVDGVVVAERELQSQPESQSGSPQEEERDPVARMLAAEAARMLETGVDMSWQCSRLSPVADVDASLERSTQSSSCPSPVPSLGESQPSTSPTTVRPRVWA